VRMRVLVLVRLTVRVRMMVWEHKGKGTNFESNSLVLYRLLNSACIGMRVVVVS
jgi:hypothetical protein